MSDGEIVPGSLYIYAPNKVAPIIFTVAYAASAVGHIWQCYCYKSFKLIGIHPVCAVIFTAGYGLREYGAFHYLYNPDNSQNLLAFVLSQVFIYICPPLLELANYHVLGRILFYVPYYAPLPPGKVLSTFGGLMALVELLNSLGVALSSNPTSTNQGLGSNLTVAALAIQIAVILVFVILAAIFHRRCARASIRSRNVTTPLITLYVSMLLIFIRCIYRLMEHLGDTAVHLSDPDSLKDLSPLLRHEWFFYIFEATLMLLNSVLWNVWNPGRFLPRNNRIHLLQDGVNEVEDDETDSRPLIAKAGHVLTFGVFFGKKTTEGRHGYRLNTVSS
ncbi:putative RTA1 domain protein [Seiridium cardinale]|uniref:RTA1 domain protein n=1 Tax=Seiridium cardinale TaxID=138064 RepID=A0ABR2XSK8_9PEZI